MRKISQSIDAEYAYEVRDHLGNVRSVIEKEGDEIPKQQRIYQDPNSNTTAKATEYIIIKPGFNSNNKKFQAIVTQYNSEPEISSATDYYPGGLTMQGRMYRGSNNYRFGYQGQFAEKDEETGYNQFQLRLYDSRILRWNSTDPYNQYHSPYMSMGNNWVSGIDPDGGFSFKSMFGKTKKAFTKNKYSNHKFKKKVWNAPKISGVEVGELFVNFTQVLGEISYDSPTSIFVGLEGSLPSSYSKYTGMKNKIELNFRVKQIKPFSMNINTGDFTWINPKYTKYTKYAGALGYVGDAVNAAGIGININNEGWTTSNQLDAAFGIIGLFPIQGDAISFM